MDSAKTGRFLKYLISLFGAAAVLILAGGAKGFSQDSCNRDAANVKAAALLYVPSVESGQESILRLAEESPDFFLYIAADTELYSIQSSGLD